MFNKTFIVAAVALCVFAATVEAGHFTLFEHPYHNGARDDFHAGDNECHNLPGHFNDKGSSINTHGGCFALFEHGDCKGRRVIFRMNCDGGECCAHNNFKSCRFNDKATSFAMC
uniref:Beta/gamma crystallin 'Greek key' domain-containing protein n=1 Tax=Panagrellus redivivus TaxID=6233 RepID=A0A7E4ZUW4_PANRE